ncbi:MAG: hypothetical protein J0I09_14925 [Sphingobacteriia bacterium]|nr:hypothetical protein [Sphingobacteriia bacterium]
MLRKNLLFNFKPAYLLVLLINIIVNHAVAKNVRRSPIIIDPVFKTLGSYLEYKRVGFVKGKDAANTYLRKYEQQDNNRVYTDYLPLTGGNLTGALYGTTIDMLGRIKTNDSYQVTSGGYIILNDATNSGFIQFNNAGGSFAFNAPISGTIATFSNNITAYNNITTSNGKLAVLANGQSIGLQVDGYVAGGSFDNYINNNSPNSGTYATLNFGRLPNYTYGYIRSNNNTQTLELYGSSGIILNSALTGISASFSSNSSFGGGVDFLNHSNSYNSGYGYMRIVDIDGTYIRFQNPSNDRQFRFEKYVTFDEGFQSLGLINASSISLSGALNGASATLNNYLTTKNDNIYVGYNASINGNRYGVYVYSFDAGVKRSGYIRMDYNNTHFLNIGTEGSYVNIANALKALDASFNGTVTTKKLIVTQTGWPDFVFKPNYNLRTLSEVEQYIKIHQHLPDIPSEKEVKSKGIDVGETQAMLLRKIEELTLYVIKQERRIVELEKQVSKNKH